MTENAQNVSDDTASVKDEDVYPDVTFDKKEQVKEPKANKEKLVD